MNNLVIEREDTLTNYVTNKKLEDVTTTLGDRMIIIFWKNGLALMR
jgi:hypothetical protein